DTLAAALATAVAALQVAGAIAGRAGELAADAFIAIDHAITEAVVAGDELAIHQLAQAPADGDAAEQLEAPEVAPPRAVELHGVGEGKVTGLRAGDGVALDLGQHGDTSMGRPVDSAGQPKNRDAPAGAGQVGANAGRAGGWSLWSPH